MLPPGKAGSTANSQLAVPGRLPVMQPLNAEAPERVCNMCNAPMKLLADFRGGLRPAARIFRCYNCNNVISERPMAQDVRREGASDGNPHMPSIQRSCPVCSTTMQMFDRQPVDEEHEVSFYECPKCRKSSQIVTHARQIGRASCR